MIFPTLAAILAAAQLFALVGIIMAAFRASDPIDVKLIRRMCRRAGGK